MTYVSWPCAPSPVSTQLGGFSQRHETRRLFGKLFCGVSSAPAYRLTTPGTGTACSILASPSLGIHFQGFERLSKKLLHDRKYFERKFPSTQPQNRRHKVSSSSLNQDHLLSVGDPDEINSWLLQRAQHLSMRPTGRQPCRYDTCGCYLDSHSTLICATFHM
jgi:hypothetical protein